MVDLVSYKFNDEAGSNSGAVMTMGGLSST